ncbi:MAG: ZIP family metal transporter [bacterium]|nr:ZIP family metal transporter [bacterium]
MNSFFTILAVYTLFMALAVFLGGILPLIRKWDRRYLPIILSLAAGLMLGSAFFHLIPEAFSTTGKTISFYILAGFLFLFLIEKFITVHICEIFDCEVHRIGISAFIGIAIHTLTDGVALGSGLMIPGLGFVVFLAIVSHKAPELFSLTTVLIHTGTSRWRIFWINLIILALVPLGATLAYAFLKPSDPTWIGRAVGFSAGTFLHISLSDLLPEAHRHSSNRVGTTLALLLGLAVMWVLEISI